MRHLLIILLLFSLFSVPGCILFPENISAETVNKQLSYTINNKRYYPIPSAKNFFQQGIASWYGPGFHGRKTANGEIYNMYAMTAAHTILPMDTILRVKNLENGLETIVRVNDRGPFISKRILDLSYAAAKTLGMLQPGTARVAIHALATKVNPQQNKTTQKKRTIRPPERQGKEYYIQIGAFFNYKNALRLQQSFSHVRQKTVIKPIKTRKGRILYLVQIYAGKIYQNAQRIEKKLLKKGYKGAFVINNQ